MIFVDTSAFVAIQDARDSQHEKAMRFKAAFFEAGDRFITSDYILSESYTLIRIRAGHHFAVLFGENVRNSGAIHVVHVTPEIIESAWSVFKKYSDHRFSFTDCTSFVVMKQMRVSTAFTFDSDFRALGQFLVKP